MPAKKSDPFNVAELTKGQLRKLNALRKSLGDEIADAAFAKWLKSQPDKAEPEDKNAIMIKDALESLVDKRNLRIPRGGYHVRRGRGRVIVERAG